MSRRLVPLAALAIVAALAILSALVLYVYLPTLDHGWAPLDDELNFTRNPDYRGLSADHLRWMATTRLAGHYIPLSWLTLALDHQISGMDPRGYHRTNLLIHLANAWLFFALAWRLFGRSLPRAAPGAPEAPRHLPDPVAARLLGAFAAAAIFALHPLRVESVAWITERRDLLCGFFCLLAVHAYLSAARAVGRPRLARLALAGLAFAAALLSKGIAVVLPVALVALDLYPLRRLDLDPRRWLARPSRAVLLEKLPFLALSALFAAVTFWAIAPVMSDRTQAGLEHRLLSAGFGLSFYLEKTLAPFAIPFQVPATHLLSAATHPGVLARGLAFLAVLLGSLALWRRRPAVPLALIVFTAFVLPVSGLFQAGPQLAAHRYTYLSVLSIALLLGGGLAALARRFAPNGPPLPEGLAGARGGAAGLVLAALFVATLGLGLALAAMARAQVALWRDDVSFASAAVAAAPGAWQPVGALARAHLARGEGGPALAALREGRRRLPQALLLTYLESLILATSPDGALRDGERAAELASGAARATSYQDPAALFALAAATAEVGDSEGALRLLDGAEALSRAGRKPEMLPLFEEAERRIRARGVLRLEAADWRGSLL